MIIRGVCPNLAILWVSEMMFSGRRANPSYIVIPKLACSTIEFGFNRVLSECVRLFAPILFFSLVSPACRAGDVRAAETLSTVTLLAA